MKLKFKLIYVILLNFHFFNHQVVLAQVSEIVTGVHTFGDGYNSATGRFSAKKVVEYGENTKDKQDYSFMNSKNEVSYTLQAQLYSTIEEKKELSRSLRSLNIGYKSKSFEANLSYSKVKTRELMINSKSTYLICQINAIFGTEILLEPKLTKEATKQLRGGKLTQDFLRIYGDEFVKYQTYGSSVTIIFESKFNSLTEEKKTVERLKLAAKYWKISADATFIDEDIKRLFTSDENVNIYINTVGIDAKKEIPSFTLDSIMSFIKRFTINNGEAKNIISVGTEKIWNLLNTQDSSVTYRHISKTKRIDRILDIIAQNSLTLGNINEVLVNPDKYQVNHVIENMDSSISRAARFNGLAELVSTSIVNSVVSKITLYSNDSKQFDFSQIVPFENLSSINKFDSTQTNNYLSLIILKNKILKENAILDSFLIDELYYLKEHIITDVIGLYRFELNEDFFAFDRQFADEVHLANWRFKGNISDINEVDKIEKEFKKFSYTVGNDNVKIIPYLLINVYNEKDQFIKSISLNSKRNKNLYIKATSKYNPQFNFENDLAKKGDTIEITIDFKNLIGAKDKSRPLLGIIREVGDKQINVDVWLEVEVYEVK